MDARPGVPAVTTAVRGMAALDFSLSTARGNLHSGIYGGAVPNALSELAKLLASLHDENGRVAVAGFYDRVAEVGAEERARWAAFAPTPAALREDAGSFYLAGEEAYSPLERVWSRPTLEINGAWGGHLGEGIHTIVPAIAHAKLSCRLVADQDPQDVIDRIVEHLRAHAPAGAELVIESALAGAAPLSLPADSPAVRAAVSALESVWERPAVVGRAGYSVPAAEVLARHARGNAFLMGFALPGERAHGPDEHFHLENFRKGMRGDGRLLARARRGDALAVAVGRVAQLVHLHGVVPEDHERVVARRQLDQTGRARASLCGVGLRRPVVVLDVRAREDRVAADQHAPSARERHEQRLVGGRVAGGQQQLDAGEQLRSRRRAARSADPGGSRVSLG